MRELKQCGAEPKLRRWNVDAKTNGAFMDLAVQKPRSWLPRTVIDVTILDTSSTRYQTRDHSNAGYAAMEGAADKQTRCKSHASATVLALSFEPLPTWRWRPRSTDPTQLRLHAGGRHSGSSTPMRTQRAGCMGITSGFSRWTSDQGGTRSARNDHGRKSLESRVLLCEDCFLPESSFPRHTSSQHTWATFLHGRSHRAEKEEDREKAKSEKGKRMKKCEKRKEPGERRPKKG